MRYIIAWSLIGCIAVFITIMIAVFVRQRRRRHHEIWGKQDQP